MTARSFPCSGVVRRVRTRRGKLSVRYSRDKPGLARCSMSLRLCDLFPNAKLLLLHMVDVTHVIPRYERAGVPGETMVSRAGIVPRVWV